MYTLFFFVASIVAFIILVKNQPVCRRTFFEPNVIILGLFSLCYLVPTLAIVFGADVFQIDNLVSVENLSLYGFLFVVSYAFFVKVLKRFPRRHIFQAINLNINFSPRQCFIGFFICFVAIKIILIYYGAGASNEYVDQYLARSTIPQNSAQVINLLQSVQWMFMYLLLASSFIFSSGKYSLRFIRFVFIVLFVDMLFTNSRSIFVTFSIVFMAAYTFYNRPIGLRKEFIFSISFIIIMGVFAFKRVDSGVALNFNLLNIMIPSEFIMIYRNALHLGSITSEFVQPPGSSYLQSLIAFIPKQVNAGKWDPASWYVGAYFSDYAEVGGGLAFGIIPEAIINWGLISMVFQASIISVFFRIAYSYANRNRFFGPNVWVVFYLYCFTQIYQVIRNHSFSIIGGLFLGFVVPFLMLLALNRIRFR